MRDIYALHAGEPTADESAEIKGVLRDLVVSERIEQLARTHITEADEACIEVEKGHATAKPGSWVDTTLNSID